MPAVANGQPRSQRPISDNIRQKAERLVRDGRVIVKNVEEFDVIGDHDTYSVWIPGGKLELNGQCSCPAWGPCSHIEAAKLTIAAENGGEV